ncbi:MAG: hypothetical protein IJV80_03085 [Clostridia bacterium]|nr:hypothetical protein [Clostridia bacterium]
MKIRYLGTGAAEGVPAMFCNCETCKKVRARGENEYHTRSQIYVDESVCIDFPADAYLHSVRFGVDYTKLKHLIITHSHCDHFYAHEFILRGYKYGYGNEGTLTIYGNAEVKKVFEECTRREMREDVKKNLQVVELKAFEPVSFGEANEYTVLPIPAQHSKAEQAFVFLIEKGEKRYLHLTDSGRLSREIIARIAAYLNGKTVNLVAFDCTFLFATGGEVSRHMGLEDNLAMQRVFEEFGMVSSNTQYVITHYSHNNLPLVETLKKAQKIYGFQPAFDGLIMEI